MSIGIMVDEEMVRSTSDGPSIVHFLVRQMHNTRFMTMLLTTIAASATRLCADDAAVAATPSPAP